MTDSSSSYSCSTPSSATIGVRRALMTPSHEMSAVYCLSGIITSLTALETDYKDEVCNEEERSSYQPSKRHRMDMVLNRVQKCQLMLRDKKYSDVVALYTPYNNVSSLSVGMEITITNCKLCLSQGKKKKLYVVLSTDKTCKSTIAVVEPSNSTLEPRGSQFVNSHSTNINLTLPLSSIYSLLLTSTHNRCLWIIPGHVVFLKKIFVSLRCSVCCRLARSTNNNLRFTCPNKCPGSIVTSLWETSFAFDDGTAEADVRLEGKAALFVLRAIGDTQCLGLKHVQSKVEKWVERTGKFLYDSISAKYERDAEEYREEVQFGSDLNSSDEICKLMDAYLINCSYLRNYELVCSVDHSVTSGNASSSSVNGATASKKVHLQEVNTEHPHRVQFNATATRTCEKLALTGHAIRELRQESLRLAAWDLLTRLEDDDR